MNERRLRENWESVQDRIAEAVRRSGRDPVSVTLVAVTKRCPVEVVQALVALGAGDFGENYPQELREKVDALPTMPARWHLIGHLQGNKAKKTMPLVRMIHGVDSLRLLQTLDRLAAEHPDPPPVCLQVNASGEASKHGWAAEEILAESDAIAACRSIPIVGLMTMAAPGPADEVARPAFARLRTTRGTLRDRTGLVLDHLSMGMSDDFEVAIEEGSTLIRVGSSIVGGTWP